MKSAAPVRLACDQASAIVDPAAGLIVSSFSIGSKQILFPDGIIDSNGKKKRRGGIPILFPQAGALKESMPNFNLAQHGFARDLPWEIVRVAENSRQATFRLRNDGGTRAQFPFDFEVRVKIDLEPAALSYQLAVYNPSSEPLWCAPGLHPYFAIPPRRRMELQTNVMGFQIDTYRMDDSLILMPQRVDLDIPEIGRVSMIPSGEFLRPASRLVVWADIPDYMCFEPWSAGVGSLFRAGERLEVPPSKEVKMAMRIEVG